MDDDKIVRVTFTANLKQWKDFILGMAIGIGITSPFIMLYLYHILATH